MPGEVIHSRIGLAAAGQREGPTRIHHTGGTGQHGRVLRRVWEKLEGEEREDRGGEGL